MVRLLLVAAAALALTCDGTAAAKLDSATVNQAQFSPERSKGFSPVILKAQILLDRARFSPGMIEGRFSDNAAKAIRAFQTANGLSSDGKLTPETWDRLTATSTNPVVVSYELTRKDVSGPFTKRIPARMEKMARLRTLGYHDVTEKLAERFHISEQLLRRLNPGIGFMKAGTKLLVPDIDRGDSPARIAGIEVDKGARLVRVLDPSGKWLAVFPASIGSAEKPAPSARRRSNAARATPPITTIRTSLSRGSKPSGRSRLRPDRTIPWDRSGSICPSRATVFTARPNRARSARPSRMAASG